MWATQISEERFPSMLFSYYFLLFQRKGISCFASPSNRAKLEELSRNLLNTVKDLVGQVVTDAGLKPEDLHAVEIVGGGTRIPCVQDTIVQALGGKVLSKTLDSAGSVALGATVMVCVVLRCVVLLCCVVLWLCCVVCGGS